MSDSTANLILALATENTELRAALAEAQELLIETAVDAGEMHALSRICKPSWPRREPNSMRGGLKLSEDRASCCGVADGLLQHPPLDACAPAVVANADRQISTESTRR